MNDFKNIVEFLRLRRRLEEAEKNLKPQTDVLLTYLEDNGSYHADKNSFETDFNKYKRVFHILEDYNAENIYLWETSVERKYFVKTPVGKFFNLLDQTIEIVSENELTVFPREFATSSYIYDTEKNRVVILAETLKEVVVFPDIIYYNPEGEYLKEVDNDEYQYSYSDHTTFFAEVIKVLFLDAKRLVYDSEKKVFFQKAEKSGRMRLIPFLNADIGHKTFVLKYPYFQKGYQPTFRMPDEECAMIMKFASIGGILSFLNETLFNQGFDLTMSENNIRDTFRQQFMDQIIHTLEDRIKSDSQLYYQDVMEILYYLPESIAVVIDNEVLWMLVEEGVRRDSLTNKLGIAEENIYIKLLEIILQKEGQENRFIERLNQKIKDAKKYVTVLEYLYDRIHGDNAVKFATLVNKAWKKSRFINPDKEKNTEFVSTDGPLILPYHSEKWLGFYFSNVSVSFDTDNKSERLLKTLYDTGKYKTEMRPGLKTDNLVPTQVEIVDRFWYHPFHPIYLKDIENQETDLKLDKIVPAFMLKANRDKQFWGNVMTTVEYTADIVTTFSGIGNIAKFRYLTRVVELAEVVEGASAVTKVARAANILRYVKGAAGVVELTSGSVNLMLKITGAKDTEFGESLSKVLFYLELITLAGELTASMKLGLKNSAKEAVEESDGALRVKHPELFAELYKIAGLKKVYQHVDDFMKTRPKFHDINLVNQLWKEKIINKLLFPTNLRKLYLKYLEEFPGLRRGFNQAEFKTTILNKGQKVEEVVEFSLSGDKDKLLTVFGDPPSLPQNTIDILSDYNNFEAFVKGAKDFGNRARYYDSEIKYIFNFLKNHIDKGDEFIIETQNIFKTCGSCRREFVMLEDYLKAQGKKVKFVVFSDETIEGTAHLKKKLKIK